MTDPSPILAVLAILTAALPACAAAAIHEHHRKDKPHA